MVAPFARRALPARVYWLAIRFSKGVHFDNLSGMKKKPASPPRWEPGQEQRALVEGLTAIGLALDEQLLLVKGEDGRALGADEFGQIFGDQIKRGRAAANAQLGKALYERALAGNARAFRQWQNRTTGETVETRELAMWIGVGIDVIADMERRGVVHKVAHGLYPLRKTVAAVVAHYREIIEARGGAEAIGGLVGARARLASEQADRVAMCNAEMREALSVPLRDVNAKLKECNQIVRTRLLALPSEMAPRLHACRTVSWEHQTTADADACPARRLNGCAKSLEAGAAGLLEWLSRATGKRA